MVDVDYYVDMPRFLCEQFKPTLLYTFQPEQVARHSGEYSYTFTSNNEVKYIVAGGGRYSHRVWNFGVDSIIVRKRIMGVPVSSAAYLVDRRRIADDHYVISLTPQAKWGLIGSILVWLTMSGNELKRLSVVEGQYLRLRTQTADGAYVSTGVVNSYVNATVKADHDDAIAISCQATKTTLQLPNVMRFLPNGDEQTRSANATALLAYHRKLDIHSTDNVDWHFPVSEAVRSYVCSTDGLMDDPKPMLTAFACPIIHGAYAPFDTPANEKAAIEGRVTKFTQSRGKNALKLTAFLDRVMNEFVDLLVPNKYLAIPMTFDDVYERQPRPSQRSILERSMYLLPDRIVKSFMKREAYQNPKEPRIISTINGPDKREYSRYMYVLADHLKKMHWYAFGKNPRQVSERIAFVCEHARWVSLTDFNRFDGTISELVRILEHRILVAFFSHEYTYEVTELHKSQFCNKAIGRHKTKYETSFTRLSGSPETSANNCIVNAFVAFLGYRQTKINGAFMSKEEAWSKLGAYGGDDGISAEPDANMHEKAARMLGLNLKIDIIQRDQPGVQFLARVYGPFVWNGSPNSCCDIYRQLSKFHTTVKCLNTVTPVMKLLEKSRALYLTDANTPVLGELACKVVELHGDIDMDPSTARIRKWNSELPKEDQYPNVDEGWMESYCVESLSKCCFDYNRFKRHLDECKTLDDLLHFPLCSEIPTPVVKIPVVVDGNIVRPVVSKVARKPARKPADKQADKNRQSKANARRRRKRRERL
jgi:hypothetical protein